MLLLRIIYSLELINFYECIACLIKILKLYVFNKACRKLLTEANVVLVSNVGAYLSFLYAC